MAYVTLSRAVPFLQSCHTVEFDIHTLHLELCLHVTISLPYMPLGPTAIFGIENALCLQLTLQMGYRVRSLLHISSGCSGDVEDT